MVHRPTYIWYSVADIYNNIYYYRWITASFAVSKTTIWKSYR